MYPGVSCLKNGLLALLLVLCVAAIMLAICQLSATYLLAVWPSGAEQFVCALINSSCAKLIKSLFLSFSTNVKSTHTTLPVSLFVCLLMFVSVRLENININFQ